MELECHLQVWISCDGTLSKQLLCDIGETFDFVVFTLFTYLAIVWGHIAIVFVFIVTGILPSVQIFS